MAVNPLLWGWGEYYKRAHVRRLFHRLDHWIRRRIWSHRCKHWRNAGWTPEPWTAVTCTLRQQLQPFGFIEDQGEEIL
jgi:Group II intron, maturase-specific domain